MINLKDYSLSNDIKRKLGIFIRITRTLKQKEYPGLIENNPYTKENLSKEICHYHTLTKLENDIVKEDLLYHLILNKLGYYFQIEKDHHDEQMDKLYSHLKDIIIASEYIDDNTIGTIIDSIGKIKNPYDCIMEFHIKLLEFNYSLQKFNTKEDDILLIENYLEFFDGLYKGLAYHCLGINYLKRGLIIKSEKFLMEAKNIYQLYDIGHGLINSNLINIYESQKNYLKAVRICDDLEGYYVKNNNYTRLIHIYNFLSYYYIMFNDIIIAKRYYQKCMDIIDKDEKLDRFKSVIQFTFGLHLFKNHSIVDSLEYVKNGYMNCQIKEYKLNFKLLLLIILTLNKVKSDEIKKVLYDGFDESFKEQDKSFIQYFKYKYEKPKYYRKYALEKLIPLFKNNEAKIEELLFLYEDIYK